MMMFRAVQVYCPVNALPVRISRQGPPMPPEQRPIRYGGAATRRQADSCPGYAATGPARRSPDTQRFAPVQLG
jgi:hypothetical protein